MASFARIRRAGVAVALALLMATALAGAAYAATLVGTAGPDELRGTPNSDEISGLGGDDFIVGRGADDDLSGGRSGPDYIVGGRGVDEHYSQGGNDRIEAADGKRDFVNCGSGEYDRASVDADEDVQDVVKNCEIVNGQPMVAPE